MIACSTFTLILLSENYCQSASYNPCIERPKFVNPSFARPQFAKPEFEKPKIEEPPLEKPNVVSDDFVKPEFVRPVFELPKFQDCAAIKAKKSAFEQALIDYPQKPVADLSKSKENSVVNKEEKSETPAQTNPNSFYFYKPPATAKGKIDEDCCGAVIQKQLDKTNTQQQVVAVKKLEIR